MTFFLNYPELLTPGLFLCSSLHISTYSAVLFTYAFSSGTGLQDKINIYFWSFFPMRGKFFSPWRRGIDVSGDVNAEVRVYQPSLRYDFDNIFHQDMRWSDEQAMLSVPTHENKAFFPFDIWNWGWSPNLRTPVCTQVRLYTAETPQKAVGFLFYHICHRSLCLRIQKFSLRKKPSVDGRNRRGLGQFRGSY